MDYHYPFTKCLKPRRIINVYTGESLIVPCGSCPACSMRKASVNAFRCQLESCSHKYCMFITLTYNNVSIPRMVVKHTNRYLDDCGEVVDTGEPAALVDVTQRLGTQGTLLGRLLNTYVLYSLANKVNMPKGVLPHLSKYDLQLFFKRLRRNLDTYFQKNYGTEAPKIRYYACGEYGPVHFRPHYHVLLWFSSDEIYKVIRQILYKSWSFGRIDCQKSQGQCSNYVAKYLNCSVSLPLVFKECAVRPFSIHSSHLGEKVLTVSRETVYQDDFERAVKRVVPSVSADTEFFLWRTLKTYYFPKCKGYAQKSKHERLYAYTTYEKVQKWSGVSRCSEQARLILHYIIGTDYHHPDYFGAPMDLIDYFRVSCNVDTTDLSQWEFYYQRIYMELRLSRHFIEFVCLNNPNMYTPMMTKIDSFWNWDDMQNLKKQCQLMEEYSYSELFESESEFQFFFHNQGFKKEEYEKMKSFRVYKQAVSHNALNSVKHKRLNDLNQIFADK